MVSDDFPNFDDERVKCVMAAAANLVEAMNVRNGWYCEFEALKTALFAAQHSQPKPSGHQPQLANFCDKCGRTTWLVHLKAGICLDCQDVQHSKPRCDHKGIGEPGCETCDPRVQHSAPKEDRLWVELAKAASIDGDWSWERVAQRAREYIAEEIARDRG